MSIYRSFFRVKKMCQVLNASRSGYYKWKKQQESQREQENQKLVKKIKEIHEASRRTYGSPRITMALRSQGLRHGENRIARLMKAYKIRAKTKRKFKTTTQSDHPFPAADNLLKQNFYADKPNQVWVADITYVWTKEGWLYLSAILDIFSRRIVGWALEAKQSLALTSKALMRALGTRKPVPGLIHHSDRGSQYANHEYQKLLKSKSIVPSMGKKGDCYDNAVMESFFHTLKMEHIYWNTYMTRNQAKKSIFEYIELFYNPERLHSSIGYKSPLEYEKNFE